MSKTFWFHDVELAYFDHMYNSTYLNERRVEVAIAQWWLEQIMNDDDPLIWSAGLEVGNVLGHYEYHKHPVYDLHEEPAWYQKLGGQPVVSVDILDPPTERFPWVVSISTIEHTASPMSALIALKNLTATGGRLLVTFPTGVDGGLDAFTKAGFPGFSRGCTMVRRGDDENKWRQPAGPEVRPYGPWANSVAICEWEAE